VSSSADVQDVAEFVAAVLPAGPGWDERPTGLDWTCRETSAHVVRCLTNYGALLARRATGPVSIPLMSEHAEVDELLDAVRSSGAVLSVVVDGAGPNDRAWHPAGMADASGVAAMACDEMLVHGWDVAQILGVVYEPPVPVVEAVLRRLFPWTPEGVDPWSGLLWANGRRPLNGVAPDKHWLWHCAPLEEWDGRVPRWDPGTARPAEPSS
jgi:uncharacterized protein (TIGR03083 family)